MITDAMGTSAAIKFGYADLDHFLTCASLATCPGTYALAVAHDTNGLLSSVKYGMLTEGYGYNGFGELASKTAKFGTASLLQSTYDSPNWVVANRRDALGRISHREEAIGTGATTTFDYICSDKGSLTDVLKGGSPWEHYDYCTKNGNRIAGNTPQRNVSSSQVQYDYSQDLAPCPARDQQGPRVAALVSRKRRHSLNRYPPRSLKPVFGSPCHQQPVRVANRFSYPCGSLLVRRADPVNTSRVASAIGDGGIGIDRARNEDTG